MEPVESCEGPLRRERDRPDQSTLPRARTRQICLVIRENQGFSACLSYTLAQAGLSGVSRPRPPPVDSGALCRLSRTGEAAYGGVRRFIRVKITESVLKMGWSCEQPNTLRRWRAYNFVNVEALVCPVVGGFSAAGATCQLTAGEPRKKGGWEGWIGYYRVLFIALG